MPLGTKVPDKIDFYPAVLNTTDRKSGALAAELELKGANDRVDRLEWQLLNAEETICHLKAEKLAAFRDVEQLNIKAHFVPKQVLELETRLAEQTQIYESEKEQRMAEFRDQERELTTLRVKLEDTTRQYEELQLKYMELLNNKDKVITVDFCHITGVTQLSSYEDTEKCVAGRARAPADADTVNSKWQEESVRHPTPHFDLESPEVDYILRAWTKNMRKMRYMRRWLVQVANTKGSLPDDFPMGVELPRLPPEVRDGFLTLVLPLLRKQTQREILAHCRQYNDGIHTDVRFRIVPRE
ncbi:uncharacterized protein PHALS_04223 [Plasmopara halstedii]|uniref:Uncharacterized protein n=1 Tax=Plasmopara halstedii TaxID=4781 RepID=A0A0P1A8F0_PLAHL|nr:uncharacterized protein PHALS_04223 [Plasmopara halstedii]CEG36975.1 hypothetical protein PHALS_04223 [Plasmopara halstedii]|eukprot:XP_024573344.1 hypothetical protein PHALS_04223 [Plasmopara halstedii]